MLQRKAHSLDLPLKSPLTTQQINHILDRVNMVDVLEDSHKITSV